MKTSRPIALLLCAALSVTAFAKPPPDKGNGGGNGGGDPPAAFDPEFAGIRLGGRNQLDQLVLKNRDFSAEVIAYEADEIRSPQLSVDSAGLIATLVGFDTIMLQSWSVENGFSITAPQPVHSNSLGLGPPSFSPDGTRMAYLEANSAGDPVLSVCIIHPTELACEAFQSEPALLGWTLRTVTFHPEDNDKVVIFGSPQGVITEGVYIHTLGSQNAPGPAVTQSVDGVGDVGRAQDGYPPLFVQSEGAQPSFYSLIDGQKVDIPFAGFGYNFTFNCRGDTLFHLETGSGGASLAVTPFGGPIEKVGRKEGFNINAGYDWMPKDCPPMQEN